MEWLGTGGKKVTVLLAGRGAEMHVHPESEHLTFIEGRGTPRPSIRPPEMPTVEISMLEGRTADQKRQMAKSLTTAISTSLTMPEEAVTIIIREMSNVNFAKAGKLRCDTQVAAKPAGK